MGQNYIQISQFQWKKENDCFIQYLLIERQLIHLISWLLVSAVFCFLSFNYENSP